MQTDYKQVNLAVALLLDGKSDAAVAAWNAAGVRPQLLRAVYDPNKEILRLTTRAGQVTDVSLDSLLALLPQVEAGVG